MAGSLWWLTSRRDIMGDLCNRRSTNVLAGIGFLLLLSMAAYTALVVDSPKACKRIALASESQLPMAVKAVSARLARGSARHRPTH